MSLSGVCLENFVACAVIGALIMAAVFFMHFVRKQSYSWAIAELVFALCTVALLVPLKSNTAVAIGDTRSLVCRTAEWPPIARDLFGLALACFPATMFFIASKVCLRKRLAKSGEALAVVYVVVAVAEVLAYLVVGVTYGNRRVWYEPSASITRFLYLMTWIEVITIVTWLLHYRSKCIGPVALLISGLVITYVTTLGRAKIAIYDLPAVLAWTDAVPRSQLIPLIIASFTIQAVCAATLFYINKLNDN